MRISPSILSYIWKKKKHNNNNNNNKKGQVVKNPEQVTNRL